jgi:hypothetical protein
MAAVPKTRQEGDASVVLDLQPFTRIAYVPASADLSSLKIESIKATKVATKVRVTTDLRYCHERSAVEPGGSMYCPRTSDESFVRAYQVTYSFRGQPVASDEYGNTNFSFSVYFRPDEISPALRRAISSGKIKGTAAADLFRVTTSNDSIRHVVVDQANSTICDGNYVDGHWTRTNPKCEDSLAYQSVAAPSMYITVRIDPATSPVETAAAGKSLAPFNYSGDR